MGRKHKEEDYPMTKTVLALMAAMITVSTLSIVPVKASVDGISKLDAATIVDRRKPRVPGGSGCDDPRDIIEHPECR
jgi:hypothetical protein